MPFRTPFRAISLWVSFPGLKPWAVFCSPVGRLELAQENVQTPGPFGTKAIRPSRHLTIILALMRSSPDMVQIWEVCRFLERSDMSLDF